MSNGGSLGVSGLYIYLLVVVRLLSTISIYNGGSFCDSSLSMYQMMLLVTIPITSLVSYFLLV